MKFKSKVAKVGERRTQLPGDVEQFCWLLARIIARIAAQAKAGNG